MFITPAYAETAAPVLSPGTDMVMQLLPFVLIFVVFYFLLLLPKQKQLKQLKITLDALKPGDEVVTAGGLIGKVHQVVDANEIVVEIASGVRVRVVRSTIVSGSPVLPDAAPPSKAR